jgi:RND family efflux transporter MFP subunit
MTHRSRKFAVAAGLALGLALIAGCKDGPAGGTGAGAGKSGGGDRAAAQVQVAPVRVGSAWRTVEVTGTLFGEEEATIASKLSGRVESIDADVGDRAPSGTVLARIEARDYELGLAEAEAAKASSLARLGLKELPGPGFDLESLPTVRRARAEAANAAARLDRAKQLFEQTPPLISEQDFADIRTANDVARETAETELLTAQALIAESRAHETAVAMARQKLADTTIAAPAAAQGAAPVAYEVAGRTVSLGEYVTPGQAMFRLVAMDRIDFRANVAERFAGQVQRGQQVRVWVEAYAEPFSGEVTRVSPQIDRDSRSFLIEVRIDNRDGRLKAGAFARGEVRLREEQGVTFVPASAIVTFAGVTRVFSVADGKAKEHRVRTGIRVDDQVEIIGGLPVSGVVISGAAGLAEGVPVVIGSK